MVSELHDSRTLSATKTPSSNLESKMIPLNYSYEEIEERMANGFCIFCEERDTPGHQKLKHKGLMVCVIDFEDEPVVEETLGESDVIETVTLPYPEPLVPVLQIPSVDSEEDWTKSVAEEKPKLPLGQHVEHLVDKQFRKVSGESMSHVYFLLTEESQKASVVLIKSSRDVDQIISRAENKIPASVSRANRVWEPGGLGDKVSRNVGLVKEKSAFQCSVGDKTSFHVCSLLSNKNECCPLKSDDEDETSEVSVTSIKGIHHHGYTSEDEGYASDSTCVKEHVSVDALLRPNGELFHETHLQVLSKQLNNMRLQFHNGTYRRMVGVIYLLGLVCTTKKRPLDPRITERFRELLVYLNVPTMKFKAEVEIYLWEHVVKELNDHEEMNTDICTRLICGKENKKIRDIESYVKRGKKSFLGYGTAMLASASASDDYVVDKADGCVCLESLIDEEAFVGLNESSILRIPREFLLLNYGIHSSSRQLLDRRISVFAVLKVAQKQSSCPVQNETMSYFFKTHYKQARTEDKYKYNLIKRVAGNIIAAEFAAHKNTETTCVLSRMSLIRGLYGLIIGFAAGEKETITYIENETEAGVINTESEDGAFLIERGLSGLCVFYRVWEPGGLSVESIGWEWLEAFYSEVLKGREGIQSQMKIFCKEFQDTHVLMVQQVLVKLQRPSDYLVEHRNKTVHKVYEWKEHPPDQATWELSQDVIDKLAGFRFYKVFHSQRPPELYCYREDSAERMRYWIS